jgi:hypothetical protein
VVVMVAVDITFAVDLVDGEGWASGDGGLSSVNGDDVNDVGNGGVALDFPYRENKVQDVAAAVKIFFGLFLTFF